MIRKLLRRVFRSTPTPVATGPAILPPKQHGIVREQISSGARRTCETLQQAGYRAYVVGGAVRDLIAGITPKDFDIATDATPDQVRALFRRLPSGGTIHIEDIQDQVELALMRSEHQKVAHSYVLYREEHSRLRAEKAKEAEAPAAEEA